MTRILLILVSGDFMRYNLINNYSESNIWVDNNKNII